jgi:hypothetical protein
MKEPNMSTLENPVWFTDKFGVENLKVPFPGRKSIIWAFISRRPVYCDRGHYQLNIEASFGLDDADRFPRYYMGLEVAKNEAIAFIQWRVLCMQRDGVHVRR